MSIGDGSLWSRKGVSTKSDSPPSADELAERLAKIATAVPEYAAELRTAASMLIKQECKLALVRRAMR